MSMLLQRPKSKGFFGHKPKTSFFFFSQHFLLRFFFDDVDVLISSYGVISLREILPCHVAQDGMRFIHRTILSLFFRCKPQNGL